MKIIKFLAVSAFIIGVVLQLHNAHYFNPAFGLDYSGHIEYLNYLRDNGRLPMPHEGWEMYQTPFYYLISLPSYLIGGIKAVQLQNVIYYLVYLIFFQKLISKLFPKKSYAPLIAVLSLVSLPVFNYLVPMVSNESLNSYLIGLTLLSMMIDPYRIGIVFLLILGFYNKYTVLTLGPAYLMALIIDSKRDYRKIVAYGIIFGLCVLPIFFRNYSEYNTLIPLAHQFFPYQSPTQARDLAFFTNLSWIPKIDLFHAHNYSFIGGTWNTFWHDGYQLTVPVIDFHKKAAGLWVLGFPLTLFSVMGWLKLRFRNFRVFTIGLTYTLFAIAAYVSYNFTLPYPSEVKAFFMSGLPVIYVMGIVGCYGEFPILRKLMLAILMIQLLLMTSYFWIEPWWHLAF